MFFYERFKSDFNIVINILTKSSLVLRDLDIFKRLDDKIEIGMSMSFLGSKQKIFKLYSSIEKKKKEVIRKLLENNIKTFVMISPYVKGISRIDFDFLQNLFEKYRERIFFMIEPLNSKYINLDYLKSKGIHIDSIHFSKEGRKHIAEQLKVEIQRKIKDIYIEIYYH